MYTSYIIQSNYGLQVIRQITHDEVNNIVCPDEEKGCSARDLMIIWYCGAENSLSNDIKYVMIR